VKANEACALRTDLKSTNRRHPDSSPTAGPLSLGATVRVWRRLIGAVLLSATGTLPTTCTETVRDLGHRNHRRVAVMDRFTINMTDAETTLEKFGD
jgi:hypothetical protein